MLRDQERKKKDVKSNFCYIGKEGNGTVYISVGTAKDDTTNTTSCNATSKPGRSTTYQSVYIYII